MKKVLFISNTAGFSKFNAPYMEWFHECGWQVDNVSPGIEVGYYDNQYDLPIKRFPLSFSNLKSFFELRKICKYNQYDLVHCHTPVGGVLGRLAINIKNCKTKIVYTAHGFHFYKGAPLKNWIIFFTIEKLLAKRTNCIVTINEEDFEKAKVSFDTNIRMIFGIGVNLERFKPVSKEEKEILRLNNGFRKGDFIVVYCGQFIERKNHIFLINQSQYLIKHIPNLKFCFIGSGKLQSRIRSYVKKRCLLDRFHFLGYRTDIQLLYAMSDILVSPSKQEGFPMNVVEGMACGLPVVVSNIRGHRDIVSHSKQNFLFNFDDNSFIESLITLYNNPNLCEQIAKQNITDVEYFSRENALKNMEVIYREVVEI